MEKSILKSTKKILSIDPSDDAFDDDVLMHINATFSDLAQLGIGPDDGFMIEDDQTEWDAFLLGDKRLNSVKQYVFLRVKLAFDPPPTSFVLDAMQKQIASLEWRLNVAHEYETHGGDAVL